MQEAEEEEYKEDDERERAAESMRGYRAMLDKEEPVADADELPPISSIEVEVTHENYDEESGWEDVEEEDTEEDWEAEERLIDQLGSALAKKQPKPPAEKPKAAEQPREPEPVAQETPFWMRREKKDKEHSNV